MESLGVIRGAMQTWDPSSSLSFLFSPQSFWQSQKCPEKAVGGLQTLGMFQLRGLQNCNSPNNPPFYFFTNVQMEATSWK